MGRPYAEVIGDPIAHSKSPLIHNFWLAKLGIDAEYRATRVTRDDLPAYLVDRRNDPAWRGCNVTMPLKTLAVGQADVIDADARTIRAANLIVAERGQLRASNSDYLGFHEILKQLGERDWKASPEFHLFGTGGSARAILSALTGGDVHIIGRSRLKADALADELGFGSKHGFSSGFDQLRIGVGSNNDLNRANRGYVPRYVVVNATPLGMTGHPEHPLDLRTYPSDTVVIELVYDPAKTGLVRQARKLGLRLVDGLGFLVAQAASSFQRLFGQPAPREYDAELDRLLRA